MFFKSRKIREIEAKTALFRAKAELSATKVKYSDKKPSKYEKIASDIASLTELKEEIGEKGTNWLKILENPLVLKFVMGWMSKQQITAETPIKEVVGKLPSAVQDKLSKLITK